MSGRIARALLRLYPARVRRRYGPELLELQAQLRSEGGLSHARMIRDVLTGAFLARSAGQRASVLGAVALSCVAVAVGLTLPGAGHRTARRAGARQLLLVATAAPATPGPSACFVGSGDVCSVRACAVPVTYVATTAHVHTGATAVRRATATCVSSPRTYRPGALFVGLRVTAGSEGVTTRAGG